jgi:hypothetical protein
MNLILKVFSISNYDAVTVITMELIGIYFKI